MKYCGFGCGCQNSRGYPRMRIRMRSSDTPLVSITYVGLILTKPGRFFLSAYGNSGYGQNSISNFLKNFHISEFPWCSTREDHSIDVSITNVGLILTKLRWFQLFVKSQNSNFKLFGKKIKFWGFHGVVLVKTFPLMYQLLM